MASSCRFQSTHSLRSATSSSLVQRTLAIVSIHALLAECDSDTVSAKRTRDSFNPRTPCGVRHDCNLTDFRVLSFQSTHSLRSATLFIKRVRWTADVSIHALLAECDRIMIIDVILDRVSIHALLAECDRFRHSFPRHFCGFNPRTPCGVRPNQGMLDLDAPKFQSTHSLRSATPIAAHTGFFVSLSFNPRTPCGVRLVRRASPRRKSRFQSTHSLRSATMRYVVNGGCRPVSIHALLAECDPTQ